MTRIDSTNYVLTLLETAKTQWMVAANIKAIQGQVAQALSWEPHGTAEIVENMKARAQDAHNNLWNTAFPTDTNQRMRESTVVKNAGIPWVGPTDIVVSGKWGIINTKV